ncbi:hypothetical protein B7P43_G01523 [Cryptotermes secundus]|uniref:Uncharacterized protein n=1 Tax=Cryptotermes secundus TaxID=105785 RepID=A0A2J7RET6_9NEOP|nr:hypothetical protein B7P43_G01523 [Cryptotermes secundus]
MCLNGEGTKARRAKHLSDNFPIKNRIKRKTKYILLSHYQNEVQNDDVKTVNRSFENVTQFKYLGMTVINQIYSEDGIRVMLATLQSRTFSLFVFCLEMFIISSLVLYGCETWSLILREEHRVKIFAKRVLRRMLGPKRWSDGRLKSSIIRMIKERRLDSIKMDPREIEWGGMDWNDLAQDSDQWRALVNTVMTLRFP